MQQSNSVSGATYQLSKAHQTSTHSNLLNNRYEKMKKLGEGSYGTVFLAIDHKPEGIKRKVDAKVLNLLDKVGDDPSTKDTEMTDQTVSTVTAEEQKEALQILGNRDVVFNQNDAFEQK